MYMLCIRSRHGRNGMVVGFTTTYTIIQSVLIITKVVSSNPVSWRSVLNTTLCDKVRQ